MSYRNTVITSFIYSSPFNKEVEDIFEKWLGSGLASKVDERGYGFYAGKFKGLYSEEYQNDLKQIIPELEKATKVPFDMVVLPESSPVLVYHINPN